MKQASNSLLILHNPFMATPGSVTAFPLGFRITVRHCSLITSYLMRHCFNDEFLRVFRSPRSNNHTRLGEERIRGLVHSFFLSMPEIVKRRRDRRRNRNNKPVSFSLVMALMICLFAPFASGAIAEAEIAAEIKASLEKTENWSGADIRVELAGGMKNAGAVSDDAYFRVSSDGIVIGRKNVLVPVEIIRDGKTLRSFWVSAVVHVRTAAVSTTRKISAGETIAPDDLKQIMVETTNLRMAYVRRPEEVAGKMARRDLAPDTPLTSETFTELPLIKRGDVATLSLERNGIILTSTVLAVDDGRLGQTIRVKNIGFSSVLKAQVTGPAQVTLQ